MVNCARKPANGKILFRNLQSPRSQANRFRATATTPTPEFVLSKSRRYTETKARIFGKDRANQEFDSKAFMSSHRYQNGIIMTAYLVATDWSVSIYSNAFEYVQVLIQRPDALAVSCLP